MNSRLSPAHQKLHDLAIDLCGRHRLLESRITSVLIEIDREKFFKNLGFRSLFAYAVGALGLSESTAYAFISVARKCVECAPLGDAIASRRISVSKASRLVSALDIGNAESLIAFANSHSSREIDFEVARLRPKAAGSDRVKPLAHDLVKLEISVSRATLKKLERVQSLLSSKRGKAVKLEEVLDSALGEYIEKHDPVIKAERAKQRQTRREPAKASMVQVANSVESPDPNHRPEKLRPNRAMAKSRRTPLKATEKNAVFARDGGRCTFVDNKGHRCESDRWLHLHHVIPVSQGGADDAQNLTTLCSYHHDLVHQLSLPLDGQVNWLRERTAHYGVTLSV